jgi:hypothetical protein
MFHLQLDRCRLRAFVRKLVERLRTTCLLKCLRSWSEATQRERGLQFFCEEKRELVADTQIQPLWLNRGAGITLGVKDRIQRQAQRVLLRARLAFVFRLFVERVACAIDFTRRATHELLSRALLRRLRGWKELTFVQKVRVKDSL